MSDVPPVQDPSARQIELLTSIDKRLKMINTVAQLVGVLIVLGLIGSCLAMFMGPGLLR